MRNITNPRVIYFKGFLFVLCGLLAAGGLLLLHPDWRTAVLLGVAVWSFSRAYYFAFYVIAKYVDPDYRFSGLGSFLLYVIKGKRMR